MNKTRIGVLALTLMALGSAPALAQSAHDLMQQALVKEQAEGDLRAAIALYARIVQEFGSDRAVAAKALVQMGRCHEKLGNEDAQGAYRRVVQEYPDQADMVEEARTRLTALARMESRSSTPGLVVRELVDVGGPVDGGTPSPDGRQLVYTDWTTGDIAIRDVGTGVSRQLTTSGQQVNPIQFGMDAAFSPDGEYVAYEWHDPDSRSYYDLRIVPADGSGPPRVLYDTAGFYVMGPAWSNDGEHIAVMRYPDDDSRADLLWVSVANGSARVLDSHPVSGYGGLSHSPDDRYAVYRVRVEGEAEQDDIHVAATDGTGSWPIVQHPAEDILLGWVPDTEWVLFLSDRSNVWGAWAVRMMDGQAQGSPRLVHAGMGQAGPRGFTAAGDLHYNLPIRWLTTSVAPFDAETGQVDSMRAHPLSGSTMSPEWSPDGARLAYREEHSSFQGTVDKRTLRVLDVATGDVLELADHLNVSHPRWTLDGMAIVASAFDTGADAPDYHGGIYRIDAASGEAQLLRALPASPMWWMGTGGVMSADGGSLYYWLRGVEGQGGTDGQDGIIARRDLETGHEDVFYRDPELLPTPFGISPDGSRLLFATLDPTPDGPAQANEEGARLMLMDLSTRQVRELARVQPAGVIESVTWTEDGRYLTYAQFSPQGSGVVEATLWRIAVDGGEPERLTETLPFRCALSPDGRQIAYMIGGYHASHMVMEGLKAVLGR
jgi:Tol biopolymer transport system component